MLNAKIKNLEEQGKEQHKEAIPVANLKKLKEGLVLRMTNPWSLLRNVWFHAVLDWCRGGREGQQNLKPSSFQFAVDEEGKPYITMTHNESPRNHPGGLPNTATF